MDGNPFGGFDHVSLLLQRPQDHFLEWIHRPHFLTGKSVYAPDVIKVITGRNSEPDILS